jgi:hypothetical protein
MRSTLDLFGTWAASDFVANETLNYKEDYLPGAVSFKAGSSERVVFVVVEQPNYLSSSPNSVE